MLSEKLLPWFDLYGRHDLPWQQSRDPYRVWLSEIMLQQTQVHTVIPYFERFIKVFPTLQSLASADIEQVLGLWAGLGYYSRAKNLHLTAGLLLKNHQGQWPQNVNTLQTLPGIGRSTAGAIVSQAFNRFGVILDGNVKRVLIRYYALNGNSQDKAMQQHLWQLAESHTPKKRCGDYTQAMMDLGAIVCKRSKPNCQLCPLKGTCQAYLQNTVHLLPNKKPTKSKVQLHYKMLLICNAKQQALFYKRPLAGVWNGLWCLPIIPPDTDLSCWLNQQGFEIQSTQALPAFSHQFTHMQWHITPWLVKISEKQQVAETSDLLNTTWFHLKDSLSLAIPAPVKKILQLYERFANDSKLSLEVIGTA